MRLLALVPEAFGGFGGIAQYNRDLLQALCELKQCEKVTALPRLVRSRAVEILPEKLDFRHAAARGNAPYLLQVMRTLAEPKGYDLIVCGHLNLLPVAELLRRRFGAALMLFIYGIDAWQPPQRRLVGRLVGRVGAVVSISEVTRRRFLSWSGVPEQRTFLLPNAIHRENYDPGEKPSYLEDRYGVRGKKVLMTLGRLSAVERYKGVDELLEVLPSLLAEDEDIRYLIVGGGDDSARLASKAEQLGIQPYVVFAGPVDEREKPDHYRLADTFVMAGRGEGFGFVFLEAMACGIPVVASKLDGSREAVRDGTLGLLADPDDREDLRRAVATALARPRRVPEGLDYFLYPRFRERLGDILLAAGGEGRSAA